MPNLNEKTLTRSDAEVVADEPVKGEPEPIEPEDNASPVANTDEKTVAAGFNVEIDGKYLAVKSYSGGDLTGEKAEASSGSSQHNESTMGHNYITELTLVAYITPTDKVLSDIAHEIANLGTQRRATIIITELAKDKTAVKTFVYDQCLMTSLDFPTLDAHGGEILCQTATFKPTILTVS